MEERMLKSTYNATQICMYQFAENITQRPFTFGQVEEDRDDNRTSNVPDFIVGPVGQQNQDHPIIILLDHIAQIGTP